MVVGGGGGLVGGVGDGVCEFLSEFSLQRIRFFFEGGGVA